MKHQSILPKSARLKRFGKRELPAKPTSATVIKDPAGQYFISFVVEIQLELWFSRTYYAKLSTKCQNNKALFSKLAKLVNPKAQRFITFNLLLIPSTIPWVVPCSK